MAAGDLALRILITASGTQALAEFAAMRGGVANLGSGINAEAIAAAIGIAAIGIAAVKATGDFQQQMLHIQALAGMTKDQMQQFSTTILQMAPEVGQMPETLAKGLFQIVSALVPANEWTQTLYESGILATSGMADEVQVARILSQVMRTFGLDATTAANDITVAVTYGRMTMTDYANSIGLVSLTAHSAGITFDETNAALDVLTTHGFPSAAQAARNLNQMFQQIDLGSDAMAKRAKSLGLSFNEQAFKAMDLAHQVQYLTEVTHGNDSELKSLIGNGTYAYRAFLALRNGMSDYTTILGKMGEAQKGAGAAMNAWGITQQGFNVQIQKMQAGLNSLMILIGGPLLTVLTPLVSTLVNVTTWIEQLVFSSGSLGDKIGLMSANAQVLWPILAGIGTILVDLIVPGLWAMASALLANPLTWVVLAVVALTAAFVHWYQTNVGFRAMIDAIWKGLQQLWGMIQSNLIPVFRQWGESIQNHVLVPLGHFWDMVNANFIPALQMMASFFMSTILPILQQIGSFLASIFVPIWKDLVQIWQTQIVPLLPQLWGAIQPLMPVLKLLGAIVGVVLVTAFTILAALISGVFMAVMRALGPVVHAIASAFAGIVQIFTGFIQIISGVVRLVYDLIMGNWGKLGSDIGAIWQGVLNLVGGIFQTIGSLVGGLAQTVLALIGGFIEGVKNFFVGLWNDLVGHSIIPDMINGIIAWFGKLPGELLGLVSQLVQNVLRWFANLGAEASQNARQLVSNVVGEIGKLWGQAQTLLSSFWSNFTGMLAGWAKAAIQFGANIVNNLLSGIKNAWGAITNFVQGGLNTLRNLFPHSPVKEGPLMGSEHWGTNFVNNVLSGITAGMPRMQTATRQLAAALGSPFGSSSFTNGNNTFALSGQGGIPGSVNMTINLDSKPITEAVGVRLAKEIRIQGNVKR